MTESTVGMIICIICFSITLVAILGSIGYITNKVNKIEMVSKACLEEVEDIRREMYHYFDVIGGETRHTRNIIEKIDKRV